MVRIGICYKKKGLIGFALFLHHMHRLLDAPIKIKLKELGELGNQQPGRYSSVAFFELLVHANSMNFCSYGGLRDFGCGLSILGIQN